MLEFSFNLFYFFLQQTNDKYIRDKYGLHCKRKSVNTRVQYFSISLSNRSNIRVNNKIDGEIGNYGSA